jgi:hypothetical protein
MTRTFVAGRSGYTLDLPLQRRQAVSSDPGEVSYANEA